MTALQAQLWVESFSSREYEILALVSNGLSNREIAQKLHLSIETVKWYNKQMFMKLGVNNRIQAVNKAVELNLLDSNLSVQEKLSFAGNLPAELTSYVGRAKEIGEVKELLKNNRLVVLTGPGGSGKTRLALKVGEKIQREYKDGVWFIELANVREPSYVLGAIASALKVTESRNAPLDEVLKRFLSKKHLLLLIDNLEHLLDCAPLIGDLLAAVPELSVLATSRERLHIYGEQEYPVYPLDLPDLVENRASEELANVESIALFIKRAKAVDPTISLDDEALTNLVKICVRLDGLPLAIELCAPMVKVFSLDVIAERIEKGLDAIPGGPRDLPARQQTLRDTIQWSYDLLDENERRLFDRLSVFNGGGTLHAVNAICGNSGSGNIGNLLSRLVNKNMVLARERGDGEMHFGLLETIRQFGREKLLASEEVKLFADRHAEYYLGIAEEAAVELRGPDQIIWMERLVVMNDNIGTALEWFSERRKIEAALKFTCILYEFWLRHGDLEIGRRWLGRVMDFSEAAQFQDLYIEALNCLARLSWLQGRIEKAMALGEQALELAHLQPGKINLAVALTNLGVILIHQEEDFARGRAYIEESVILCQDIHAEWELARAFMYLGVAYSRENDYNCARSQFSKSHNLYKKLGDINFQGNVKLFIGDLELKQKNLPEGEKAYRESLVIANEVENNFLIGGCLWRLARVTEANKSYSDTVKLYTAGKRIFENIGAWFDGDDLRLQKELESVRNALGETDFQSAWEAGQNMTMEEVIEFALSEPYE